MAKVCFTLTNNTSQIMRFHVEPECWPEAELLPGKELWITGEYQSVPITVSFSNHENGLFGQIWPGDGDVNSIEVKEDENAP